MHVTVLLFAIFRERIGQPSLHLELAAPATVADVLAQLQATYPIIASLRGRFRVAVNQQFVDDQAPLAAGDELALIPPVSGGNVHAIVVDEPLSLDRCVANVAHRGAGAVVTFTGNVREQSRGTTVTHLEYEAYRPMAEAKLKELIGSLEKAWPGVALAVEHRVGSLQIGEAAVVIAASAPHRKQAFLACEAMIDQLKECVPIWKKEFAVDGAVWVGLGP